MFASHYNSAGVALGCGLDDRGSRVRFSAGGGNFSLRRRVRGPSGLVSGWCRGLFSWGWGGWGVGLATRLRLVSRSGSGWGCASASPVLLRGHERCRYLSIRDIFP